MAADLIHILPAWFRPVREFQVIMEAHGAALDQAEKQIRQTWDNCFIQTADADTIRMYEELFGLVYKPGETLEFPGGGSGQKHDPRHCDLQPVRSCGSSVWTGMGYCTGAHGGDGKPSGDQ